MISPFLMHADIRPLSSRSASRLCMPSRRRDAPHRHSVLSAFYCIAGRQGRTWQWTSHRRGLWRDDADLSDKRLDVTAKQQVAARGPRGCWHVISPFHSRVRITWPPASYKMLHSSVAKGHVGTFSDKGQELCYVYYVKKACTCCCL